MLFFKLKKKALWKISHIIILSHFPKTEKTICCLGQGHTALKLNVWRGFHPAWSQFLLLHNWESDGTGDHKFYLTGFLIGGPEKHEIEIVPEFPEVPLRNGLVVLFRINVGSPLSTQGLLVFFRHSFWSKEPQESGRVKGVFLD